MKKEENILVNIFLTLINPFIYLIVALITFTFLIFIAFEYILLLIFLFLKYLYTKQ